MLAITEPLESVTRDHSELDDEINIVFFEHEASVMIVHSIMMLMTTVIRLMAFEIRLSPCTYPRILDACDKKNEPSTHDEGQIQGVDEDNTEGEGRRNNFARRLDD